MSNYFNQRRKAIEYTIMSEKYDGSMQIDLLNLFLKPGSKILELGIGPGKDMEILSEKHRVTGSDISRAFLDLYREKYPAAKLQLLDAATMETDQKFDCIYSNKVLHQLSRHGLVNSFKRQVELLNPGGLLCHSMWYGDKEIVAKGKKFQYYNESTIQPYLQQKFEILLFKKYMAMIPDDSFVMILKKCS